MMWSIPEEGKLLSRLMPPTGRVDMVLDTDTYNEVDDQFALCYSLLSPESMRVLAVYAAPFFNDRATDPEDGMVKSYNEIRRLLGVMKIPNDSFAYEGSCIYLPDEGTPVESPAARDLVERAMKRPLEDPLYVVAIGAPTNVASAILMEPAIRDRIVVVWLGGNPICYPTAREFNLAQDIPAVRVLMDCGVPLVLVPCMGVASHLLTSIPEMEACLKGHNSLCDTLLSLFSAYTDDPFAWAKEIWDVATIAYLVNPAWIPTHLTPSPLITDDCHWAQDARRHPIRIAYGAERNPIFRDLYQKLAAFKA